MIYHITTVHRATDTRLQKYLKSRDDMRLICLNRGETESDKIIFIKKYSIATRMLLILFMPFYCLKYLNRGDSVVFHDPELIFSGFILKIIFKGYIKIIFDAHENVLQDIQHKYWIDKRLRSLFRVIFSLIFKYLLPKFDMITTVTEPLIRVYLKYNKNVKLLPNLPLLKIDTKKVCCKKNILDLKHVYVGSISVQRGIYQILEMSKILNNKVVLIGEFSNKKLMEDVKSSSEWSNIDYRGYLDNDRLGEVLKNCEVGILFLEDIDTFRDSLPVKIFDYAQHGLIIAWTGSDHCFYKDYVLDYENIYYGANLKEASDNIKQKRFSFSISKPNGNNISSDWISSIKGVY